MRRPHSGPKSHSGGIDCGGGDGGKETIVFWVLRAARDCEVWGSVLLPPLVPDEDEGAGSLDLGWRIRWSASWKL